MTQTKARRMAVASAEQVICKNVKDKFSESDRSSLWSKEDMSPTLSPKVKSARLNSSFLRPAAASSVALASPGRFQGPPQAD